MRKPYQSVQIYESNEAMDTCGHRYESNVQGTTHTIALDRNHPSSWVIQWTPPNLNHNHATNDVHEVVDLSA